MAALHRFGQLVDLAEIRQWLEKHDWWVFINRNIREAILTQFWQILLALIAALKAFSRIDPLATAIAKRYLPEFPWFLSNPKRSHRSDFAEYGELALVGRSEELAALERFLDRDVKFSWWWLNGRGGSGKSRLTREWMRMLPKPTLPTSSNGYDAGFLRQIVQAKDERIGQWKPRHPTVIVVDDVSEHAEVTLTLLTIFGQQESGVDYPVGVFTRGAQRSGRTISTLRGKAVLRSLLQLGSPHTLPSWHVAYTTTRSRAGHETRQVNGPNGSEC